jgi:TIR domain
MKSVFISYAREDLEAAKALAEALTVHGYDVWWDWHLIGGSNYRDTIRSKLETADKVIVIWSPASTASSFVIDEASAGRRQGKLIPVAMDSVDAPLGFGDLHTIAMSGSPADAAAIAAAIESKAAPAGPSPVKARRGGNASSVSTGVAVAAAAAAAGVAWWFLAGPGSARVFKDPTIEGGTRLDYCLHWAKDCGEPAATAWCKTVGFNRSTAHKLKQNVPPTYVIGDRVICKIPECTAFVEITCIK